MLRAAIFGLTIVPSTLAQEPVHHLVQVHVRDAQSFQKLLSLDLDLAACTALVAPQRLVDVIATDVDIKTKLASSGLDFEIAITNLEDYHAKELAKGKGAATGPLTLTPGLGQGAMGGHYTLAEVVSILDGFAATYPNLCTPKVSIGKSIENRDLWMVKISDNVFQKENEPEVYFDGLHHAREPLSVATTLAFMDWLLSNYGKDQEATFLVNNRELYFVPVVNPDGYEYNRLTNPGGGGMWRKNRRANTGGSFGVDLNRNYTTGWSAPNGGNSTQASSDTYRGTAPFSEPETQAIESFVSAHNFVLTFSTHTYTDILLRPFGYQVADPTNVADYNSIGAPAVTQNGILQGQTATLLYIAAGCAIDHHHVAHGAFSWTAELGKSSEGGFWPNPATTVAIATRHQHMFKTMAQMGGSLLSVPTVVLSEAPGGNNNGTVEPGEGGRVVVTLKNGGAAAAYNDVTATLSAITPGITVTQGTYPFGKPARFSSASNTSAPLQFTVPANFQGPVVRLSLSVSGDGLADTREVRIVYGSFRTAVDDDFEKDRGFARSPLGTATAGLWERAAPQQTLSGSAVIQPGSQHTPSGASCLVTDGRAGSSADDYDVDGGYTDVISPRLDLAHLAVARLSLWRWYTETATTAPDEFEIFVSNDDGAQWTRIFASAASTSAWVNFVQEIPIALTDKMRLRVRAQDGAASLVEALVDDLRLEALCSDASLTLLSSGVLATDARFGMCGKPNAAAVLCVSAGTGNLPIAGIFGALLLDPATLVALSPLALDSAGYAGVDLRIPNQPSLSGTPLYWQMLHSSGGVLTLGNRQKLALQ